MKPEETVHEIAGAFTGSVTPLVIGFILLLALKLIIGKAFLTRVSRQKRRHRASRR
ncbi:MAG TPA: hypothetical protein VNQ90_04915 [Chthoniobacteraceae bacterium]|nr:hypothetical protein [Chthoniobacteraceae bacterium]